MGERGEVSKKSFQFILVVSIILILSLSIVSASFWGGFLRSLGFGKSPSSTGFAAAGGGSNCYDSDGQDNFLVSGSVSVNGVGIYNDYCTGNTAYDYYCCDPDTDVRRCGGGGGGAPVAIILPLTGRAIDTQVAASTFKDCATTANPLCLQGACVSCIAGSACGPEQGNTGECKLGQSVCSNGLFVSCSGAVYPAAGEICGNGKDDNCNGVVDDGCTQPCNDTDGDFYGNPSTNCAFPQVDCNNNNALINPGAPEICGDSLDNDCNPATSDTCPLICTPSTKSASCGTNNCGTATNGTCAGSFNCGPLNGACNSTSTCTSGLCVQNVLACIDADNDKYAKETSATTCTPVAGQLGKEDIGSCDNNPNVNPGKTETCNGADDDCDGTTDEGGNSWCVSQFSVGYTCLNGDCKPPVVECNDNIDNDLDGKIDMLDLGCQNSSDTDESNCGDSKCEGSETATNCNADCGPCGGQVCPDPQICNVGTNTCCLVSCGYSSTDVCDNSPASPTSCGVVCSTRNTNGTTCSGGLCGGGVCVLNVECNDNIDNDGDGKIDYPADGGCTSAIDTDESNCGDGKCEGGETSSTCPTDCQAPVQNCTHSCGTKNCGNVTDSCGAQVSCGTCDSGYICSASQICQVVCVDADSDGYTSKTCGGQDCNDNSNAINPGATELCDNIDQDCDANSAVANNVSTQICGPIGVSFSNVSICKQGTLSCSVAGVLGQCANAVYPSNETCDDSLDNDCDGSVDEGCGCTNGQTKSCDPQVLCKEGEQICTNLTWGDCEVVGDIPECNVATACAVGISDVCGSNVGECMIGSHLCLSTGQWGTCDDVKPAQETCDGLDNNCDGSVDEGCGSSVPLSDYGSTDTVSDGGTTSGGSGGVSGENLGFWDSVWKFLARVFNVARLLLSNTIAGEVTGTVNSVIEASKCADADGGISYFVKGSGKGLTQDDREVWFQDFCYENDMNNQVETCAGDNCYLAEKYCEGNKVKTEIKVTCEFGCTAGACIPTAEDSEACQSYFDRDLWEWVSPCA